MTSPGRVLVVTGCLLVAPLAVPAQATQLATRADVPVHTLQVSGAGVGSYPAYAPDIERYAVTTTDDTGGAITVTATTSDPAGTIYIDGAPDADGIATVTGLDEGDEVSVFIVDEAGTARHSLVYLPARFPALVATTTSDEPLTPGMVMLGLTNQGPDFFETAVDRHGVPVHVARTGASILGSLDLKKQPNGNYSISRTTSTPGRTGQALVQMDAEFTPISTTETVGLVNTDGHDSIALPDGTVWLIAYEPNDETGLEDSIIQRIEPDGTVGFEWTSAPYVDESVTGGSDYAHVNSIDLMDDGSVLASFRGFSSVFKIDTSTPTGSVVWKLGGLDSTFAIEDTTGATDSGPCAQHTAAELDDGSILLFDNGASTPMCADPADPDGPRVARTQSRVLQLRLDEGTATAVVERAHDPGRFAQFAGSSQALDDGDVLVGWSFSRIEVATQLDPAGEEVWRLVDPHPVAGQRYFSYRAHLADVPDVTDPEVLVESPVGGEVYQLGEVVEPSYRCTDRGGSSLQTCTGGALPTNVAGQFTYEVTATDGAGNTTTVTRPYTVLPAPVPPVTERPDAHVKLKGTPRWTGGDVYGGAASQQVTARIVRRGASRTVLVRLQNDGLTRDRLGYDVNGRQRGFQVSTSAPRSGAKRLAPGQAWTLRLTVTRTRRAAPGAVLVLRVPVRSLREPSRRDAVSARVVARR